MQRQDGTSAGIPFSFIPYLYCPKCGVPLSMDNTRIQNGHLSEGELTCACGYHAAISEGIILCDDHEEDTPFKWFNNVDSVYSATDEYSGVYRILLDKDAPKSVQNIKKDHPDYPADKMPPAKFKANMKMNGFELQEMKMVGSTRGNEMHFPRNEVGEQVSMLGYTAIKK